MRYLDWHQLMPFVLIQILLHICNFYFCITCRLFLYHLQAQMTLFSCCLFMATILLQPMFFIFVSTWKRVDMHCFGRFDAIIYTFAPGFGRFDRDLSRFCCVPFGSILSLFSLLALPLVPTLVSIFYTCAIADDN